MSVAARAFDSLAPAYDDAFSDTVLGRRLRDAVQERLAIHFAAGQSVLEIGGGTGEDAVFLARRGLRVVCTDVSPGMVETAAAKVARARLADQITCRRLAIEEVDGRLGRFDGLLSNFGALNCVADLPAAAEGMAACLRPGGKAVLAIMGPGAVVETGWHLAHGRPDRAVRRWLPGGTLWRGVRIVYPTPSAAGSAFAPWFKPLRCTALGLFLPPGDAADWAARQPRLVALLDRAGRAVADVPGTAWLADHYLLELERRRP